MGAETGIAWTDHTFNPWWGCVKVSPACASCYAATFDKRTGGKHWGSDARRRFFGPKHWAAPLKWNAGAEAHGQQRRVFCASMADVLEVLPQRHPDEERLEQSRRQLAALVGATPWLDWQFLTKRPQSAPFLFPEWRDGWPVNVWLGTTVENQEYADLRIPLLLQAPVMTRFVSYEPALEAVDFRHVQTDIVEIDALTGDHGVNRPLEGRSDRKLDWLIIGGESGAGHRTLDVRWVASAVAQCQAAGAAVFVKQDSGMYPGHFGRIPPQMQIRQFPPSKAAETRKRIPPPHTGPSGATGDVWKGV